MRNRLIAWVVCLLLVAGAIYDVVGEATSRNASAVSLGRDQESCRIVDDDVPDGPSVHYVLAGKMVVREQCVPR